MRFKVSWPDGRSARVDVNDGGAITCAQGKCRERIHSSWFVYRTLLEATGANVQAFEDGEAWPEESKPWPVDPAVR